MAPGPDATPRRPGRGPTRPAPLRRGAHARGATAGGPGHGPEGRRPVAGLIEPGGKPHLGDASRRQVPAGLVGSVAALGALVVVAAGALVPVVVARASAPPHHRAPVAAPHGHRHTSAVAAAPSGPTCPLTGAPAPNGQVPQRPALAVKVDNYPAARPQAGLDQADVVFEEPVEGGITRLVAVYQCQTPPLVGGVRSAREPDVAIADELSDPLFVHAGGIQPILAMIKAANLTNVDLLFTAPQLAIHPPGRYAPYDTYIQPATVWQAEAGAGTTPPAPLFAYTTAPPMDGQAVSSVHIPFSSYSDNTWTWDQGTRQWQLSIGGTPAGTVVGSDAEGATSPVAVANVVVLMVHTFTGPWVENSEGAHEVEVQATGSGRALVLCDGRAVAGTWTRSSLHQPPVLTDAQGRTIDLTPGETWVELVPDGVAVTTTPSGGTSGSGSATGGGSGG